MYFGRDVNWTQWGSESLVLTFWNINETGKWSSFKKKKTFLDSEAKNWHGNRKK